MRNTRMATTSEAGIERNAIEITLERGYIEHKALSFVQFYWDHEKNRRNFFNKMRVYSTDRLI